MKVLIILALVAVQAFANDFPNLRSRFDQSRRNTQVGISSNDVPVAIRLVNRINEVADEILFVGNHAQIFDDGFDRVIQNQSQAAVSDVSGFFHESSPFVLDKLGFIGDTGVKRAAYLETSYCAPNAEDLAFTYGDGLFMQFNYFMTQTAADSTALFEFEIIEVNKVLQRYRAAISSEGEFPTRFELSGAFNNFNFGLYRLRHIFVRANNSFNDFMGRHIDAPVVGVEQNC
jgi:hypothetical protein